MSRPRKDDPDQAAIHKIDAAFWTLLDQVGFAGITMKLLAAEAGVNRNTLYYHYANLQEVAEAAFQSVISDAVSDLFVDTILALPAGIDEIWDQVQLSNRLGKLHLFAKSESPLLRSMLKDALTARWFQKLDIHPETLTPLDWLQIDYIVNGLVGVFGRSDAAENRTLLAAFPQTPIGKAAVQTLLRFSGNR